MSYPVKLFATTGSESLAYAISGSLAARLPKENIPGDGLNGSVTVTRFDNDNLQVQVSNVRGCFVVVIHTMVPPVNDHIVELIALLDAIRNARPQDILLVFPCYPYARSDRKNKPRISTMACTLAKIISHSLGVKRVLLLDPHDTHTKHYFEPAADEVSAGPMLAHWLRKEVIDPTGGDWVFVNGDGGAAKRFHTFPTWLRLPVAYIDKGRPDDSGTSEVHGVIGDVSGKCCLTVDDEILSAGTMIGDTNALMHAGAAFVVSAVVHGVLNKNGQKPMYVVELLADSMIHRVVITDSVPVADKVANISKFTVLTVAHLLAEAIKRTVLDQSLTDLYAPESVPLYWPEGQ